MLWQYGMGNSTLRVMPDTNVLISAVYNPDSTPARAVEIAGTDHTLVICEYVVAECREVIQRKFPHRIILLEALLKRSELEVFIGDAPFSFPIADPKDQPVLDAAVAADVDVLITGDKHFSNLDVSRPVILHPAQFLDRYQQK